MEKEELHCLCFKNKISGRKKMLLPRSSYNEWKNEKTISRVCHTINKILHNLPNLLHLFHQSLERWDASKVLKIALASAAPLVESHAPKACGSIPAWVVGVIVSWGLQEAAHQCSLTLSLSLPPYIKSIKTFF